MKIQPGYTLDVHYVITGDDYILSLCRLYKGPTPPPAADKKVVMLMPGIQSSSVDWVLLKEKSLGYMLADQG